MKNYKHLTREQRYQIYALLKEGVKRSQIAKNIGVSKSTVTRELERNRGGRGYRPKQAQEKADKRKQISRSRPRISKQTWEIVQQKLLLQWSPEQISGWLKLRMKIHVSHERIYQYILDDKKLGGSLYTQLRCQKKRRKRYGSYSLRGRLKNCKTIDERPAIVDEKKRVGDWEADTIIGKSHQQAIVSLVERKTKFTRLIKVEQKSSLLVNQAIINSLTPYKEKVKTITSDNGREFAEHESISKTLEASFYFAHPYSSWERGVNENTNGLVRQYFPKKMDFDIITDREIDMVMDRLNNRPRKSLGFNTPNELFFKHHSVALTS